MCSLDFYVFINKYYLIINFGSIYFASAQNIKLQTEWNKSIWKKKCTNYLKKNFYYEHFRLVFNYVF